MKHLLRIMTWAVILCVGFSVNTQAQKKKKEQKEKKKIEWVMPELTGNKDFDAYLLFCDTLYNRITQYSDSITFFHVQPIVERDENGKAIPTETGDTIRRYIVDENGTPRSALGALLQVMDLAMTGVNLTADFVNMGAHTTAATAALPSLGLKTVSYAKYLKMGPKIIGMGGAEVKEIVQKCKEQLASIKVYRENHTQDGVLKNPTMDLSQLNGLIQNEPKDMTDDIRKDLAKANEEDAAKEETLKGKEETLKGKEDLFNDIMSKI